MTQTPRPLPSYTSHNFVGMIDDFISPEWCDKVIEYFEQMDEAGFTTDRQKWQQTPAFQKKDDSLCGFEEELPFIHTKELHKEFIDRFWEVGYRAYCDQFDILNTMATHTIQAQKIQRTFVGGGYHVWHCEQGDAASSRRLLAYILYLNDVEEGGETEFLYFPKRVKPKKGTLLIFPSGLTHTHRGNPPMSNTKYILTGWVEF